MDSDGKDICGFDPDTLGWQPRFDSADGPVTRPLARWGAIVGDSINNRLILINSLNGSRDLTSDDVWAINLDTGECAPAAVIHIVRAVRPRHPLRYGASDRSISVSGSGQ